jgi:hypothetical protein
MTRDEAIEKVVKLFALSESPNEHEAALAAAHAKRILDKYNLSNIDVDRATGKVLYVKEYAVIFKEYNEWINGLSKAVEKHCHCAVFVTYNPAMYPGDTLLVFIGEDTNAKIAAYTLDYLANAITKRAEEIWESEEEEQWKNFDAGKWVSIRFINGRPIIPNVHKRPDKKKFIKGFCIGATLRICDDMDEQIEADGEMMGKELIIYMKDAVNEYVEKKYGDVKDLNLDKPDPNDVDTYAVSRGYEEGKDIKPNVAIEGGQNVHH